METCFLLLVKGFPCLGEVFIRNAFDNIRPCMDGAFLCRFECVRQHLCILFHACRRVCLRRKRDGFKELRRRRRLRILFRRDKEMPARLYRLLELLLTNASGLCDLLQVSKAVFFFHRHCRINIGVFKSRALHLCADNLLLYVGSCLLQFCRRGDLLQAIQHHRPCHCLLCGELLLCLLEKETPRMAHTAKRPAAERGSHTKTKSSRDSFDTCDKCIRGNIADTVRLIRRTPVRRTDNAVMDEIIGD